MEIPDKTPKEQEPIPFKYNKEEIEKIQSNDSYRGYLLVQLFETLDQVYAEPMRAIAILEKAKTYASLLREAKKTQNQIIPRSTTVKV